MFTIFSSPQFPQQSKQKMRQNKTVSAKQTYLWTVSLNFSSSKNCNIRNTSSLLKEDIAPGNPKRSSAKIESLNQLQFIWVLPELLSGSTKTVKIWTPRNYFFFTSLLVQRIFISNHSTSTSLKHQVTQRTHNHLTFLSAQAMPLIPRQISKKKKTHKKRHKYPNKNNTRKPLVQATHFT